ncbi:hypothetical protein Terranova_097 [Staphylococcus phage Terranova]|nr:hypothetical protein Terranova_097 [Staphylococcus phage Terranova]
MKIIGLNTKTGESKEFISVKEAQNLVGNTGTVKRCLEGKIKSTKGWLFRYEDSDFSEKAKTITDKRIRVYVLTKGNEVIKLPMEMIQNLYGISKSELINVSRGHRDGFPRTTAKGYTVREATEEEKLTVLNAISYIDYIKTIKNKKNNGYKLSIGEKIIKDILDYNGTVYEREYLLKNSNQRMDFYIKHKGMEYCIEYNGQQHYRDYRNTTKEKQKEWDTKKEDYCKENGIQLIIFTYKDTVLEIFNKLNRLGIVSKRPSVFTFYNGLEIDIDDFIEKYQYMDKYEISNYFNITLNDVKNLVSSIGKNLKRKFKNK